MTNRTLEQLRAAHAWDCATATSKHIEVIAKKSSSRDPAKAKQEAKDHYESYVNEIKKLPARIRTNGLGPALAYLAAKGKLSDTKPEGRLYKNLASWLTRPADPRGPYAQDGKADITDTQLLHTIHEEDSRRYRWATTEALAYLVQLKLLADALQAVPDPAQAAAAETRP